MISRTVRIVEGGKMVIPALFRRELGFRVGDTVIAELKDGELHVRSRDAAIANAQAMMRSLNPKRADLADELIADRRAEAALE